MYFLELGIYPSVLQKMTHTSSDTNPMKYRSTPEKRRSVTLTLYK